MFGYIKNIGAVLLISLSWISLAVAQETEDDEALEKYNRAVYNFNSNVDEYFMEPVAKGYRAITTDFIRERVRNFFNNWKQPISIINHGLQGNFKESGKSTAGLVINSTLGLLGMFDVASGWGIKRNKTDFDRTMATWCVPDGPFFMLPLLGPNTPRSTVGLAADVVTHPIFWTGDFAKFSHDSEKYAFYYGITALGFVSLREENIELLDSLTSTSVDAYSTVKSAYIQNRLKLNVCADKTKTEDSSASYDFDFDEEDDED